MKLQTDTKLIIAGVLVVGLGAWYVQRQVKAAASGAVDGITGAVGQAWTSLTDAVGSAAGSVYAGGRAVSDALGVSGYTDPTTGTYTPYGAIPDPPAGKSYNVPAYLGGGMSDLFDANGKYIGAYGSTAVQQATQADVRRIDNAIDSGQSTSWWVNLFAPIQYR